MKNLDRIKNVTASERIRTGDFVIVFYDEQSEGFRVRPIADGDEYISGWSVGNAVIGEQAQILVWNMWE